MRVWPGSRRSGAAPRPCTAAPSGGSKVPVPLRGRAVTARRGSPGRRGGAPSPPSAPARPLLPAAPPPARSATEPAAAAGTGTGAPGAPRRPLLWCRGDGGGAPERPAARLAPPRRAAAQRAPRRRWRQPRFGLGEQQPRGLGGAKPRARRASCEHHEGESPCSGPTPLFLAVPPPPGGPPSSFAPSPGSGRHLRGTRYCGAPRWAEPSRSERLCAGCCRLCCPPRTPGPGSAVPPGGGRAAAGS